MAKFEYVRKNLRPETLEIIKTANGVIEGFQAQGYVLTLRQLYYQFIAQDLFPDSWIDPNYNAKQGLPANTKNTEKNYKKLGDIISDGRLAGYVDWDAIEDRNRQPDIPLQFNSLEHRVESALANYRLPRWEGQDYYVELWVEKAALAGVLTPLAKEFHITLMVNRGYTSQSAMYESANRFREGMGITDMPEVYDPDYHECSKDEFDPCGMFEPERDGLLLYLGDHDPSGEDMVRDIRERMNMFGVGPLDRFRVEKVALTIQQVRQYNPPNNPAKVTDPRAKAYVAEHGHMSWEVDALDPPVMHQLIRNAIAHAIDVPTMKKVIAQEAKDKKRLTTALASMPKS